MALARYRTDRPATEDLADEASRHIAAFDAAQESVRADKEARRTKMDADGFTLVGLGDWVDALTQSDRVVHFG